MRKETDSLGPVAVPDVAYWGAQTERALRNFPKNSPMPLIVIKCLAMIKQAAAKTNLQQQRIQQPKANAIVAAAQEVIAGKLDKHFPLSIWQSGSGTQTNMNVNEVLANRACELLGGEKGDKRLVHPNDDVNLGQSTNDSFSTAMHLAAVKELDLLLHQLAKLEAELAQKVATWQDEIKVARTHLQDAVPISFGQVFSGYLAQCRQVSEWLQTARFELCAVVQGGTAVGTGLNNQVGFAEALVRELSTISSLPLRNAKNKFAGIAAHDLLNQLAAALGATASVLIKIGNDLRFLASGPRCGLDEIKLPENEPGSSIMPGKINPSQIEMLLMVCYQVLGMQQTVSLANSGGFFELNTAKPVLIASLLQTITSLSEGITSFTNNCLTGIQINQQQNRSNLSRSLMQVTSLAPKLGYDQAAKLAQQALAEDKTIQELVVEKKLLSKEEAANLLDPRKMIKPTN